MTTQTPLHFHPLLLVGFSLWGILLGCTSNKPVDTAPPPPNILFIMADDLGYNDLSCYGSERIATPNLDQLAVEGARFIDYHSNGAVCSPTRAALLSGLYQQRVGIPGVVYTGLRDSLGMSQQVHTLAESFQQAGYATALYGKWHLGYKQEFNPIHQGFDEFRGFVAGNVDYHSHRDNQLVFDWWENDSLKDDPGYTTDLITGYAIDFLDSHAEQPFFLYLPYAAPHDPYQGRKDSPVRLAAPPVRQVPEDRIPDIYQEMVEVLDEGIGKILEKLDQLGLTENTLVIFCSDNGANRHGSNGVLRGFKGGLYEGGHRVPAIARWPKHIIPGTEIQETVLSMDFFPTLLEIAKLPLPQVTLDGVSILPVLTGQGTLPERDVFWSYNQQKAMRSGDWKFILGEDQVALYNLNTDIAESRNLAADYPDRTAAMQATLRQWFEAVQPGEVNP